MRNPSLCGAPSHQATLVIILSLLPRGGGGFQLLPRPRLQHCSCFISQLFQHLGGWFSVLGPTYWSTVSLFGPWLINKLFGASHSVFCGNERLWWQNEQALEATKSLTEVLFFFNKTWKLLRWHSFFWGYQQLTSVQLGRSSRQRWPCH